ncbi:MAG TPA: hypothetical protein VN894_05355 [Polyangiaceae bacterium]|nr:hypothetical protein [Polyangiaceae bacterium]
MAGQLDDARDAFPFLFRRRRRVVVLHARGEVPGDTPGYDIVDLGDARKVIERAAQATLSEPLAQADLVGDVRGRPAFW